jgi:hypothetical protein
LQEQLQERRRLEREALRAARAAGGPTPLVQTAEELAREAQALREAEMEAMRAQHGLATAAPDAAAPLPLLDGVGRPRLCSTCRRLFDAESEYREFKCTAGCHIFLHPGACSREFERRFANENGGAKMQWVGGMRCLTDVADKGTCAGVGLMCRNAGGSRYVLFEEKAEKKGGKGGKGGDAVADRAAGAAAAAAAAQPQQQRGKSKAEKAAERAAAAAADAAAAAAAVAANAAAAEKAAAAAAEKAAADKAAADKAAAAGANSGTAAAAAAAATEKAAVDGATRKERRAPLQRPVPAPPDPGRTPSAAGIDPSELLNRSGPVKIISRKAEEEAEAALAARRASAKDKGKAPAADADAAAAAAKSKKPKRCACGHRPAAVCFLLCGCHALAALRLAARVLVCFFPCPSAPKLAPDARLCVCACAFPPASAQRCAACGHRVRQRLRRLRRRRRRRRRRPRRA